MSRNSSPSLKSLGLSPRFLSKNKTSFFASPCTALSTDPNVHHPSLYYFSRNVSTEFKNLVLGISCLFEFWAHRFIAVWSFTNPFTSIVFNFLICKMCLWHIPSRVGKTKWKTRRALSIMPSLSCSSSFCDSEFSPAKHNPVRFHVFLTSLQRTLIKNSI